MSLPKDAKHKSAETATAEPPEELPGTLLLSSGEGHFQKPNLLELPLQIHHN